MPVGWAIKLLPYCAVYNLVTGGALGQPPPVSSPCGLVLLPGEEASSHHSTRPPATQPRPQQRCMCCSFFLSHSGGLREAAGQDGQSPSPYRNLTYCGVPPSPFQDSSLNPTCMQGEVEDGSCSAPGNCLLENLSCHRSISRILLFQALTGLPFKTVYVLVYNLASRDPSPWEFLY